MTLIPRTDALPSEEEFKGRYAADVRIRPSKYFAWKRVLDLSLALPLCVIGLPLIGLLMIVIRLSSPGPAIFRQLRTGRYGSQFVMYKLRSMRSDAESKGAVWAQQHDPRVTRVGYWLRKLHLDELPQLFNVIKGDMSLLGPRPERPEFVAVLMEEIPRYMDRLAVRPGVTGLAQINLPPDSDLDSVRRKQKLDTEYIRTATPSLDFRMLAATSLRMLGLSGEWAMSLMFVRRRVKLETQSLTDTVEVPLGDTMETPEASPHIAAGANGRENRVASEELAREYATES